MIKLFVLICMIMCHIIADFHMQGILAQMKQKDWWDKNYPSRKYKNDYITALMVHSFEWTFMISIPLFVYWYIAADPTLSIVTSVYIIYFVAWTLIHAYVDNAKANLKALNLYGDQLIHLLQVVVLWFACCFIWR